jgi:inorganic pyrophosphatase/exopolyphosphatase
MLLALQLLATLAVGRGTADPGGWCIRDQECQEGDGVAMLARTPQYLQQHARVAFASKGTTGFSLGNPVEQPNIWGTVSINPWGLQFAKIASVLAEMKASLESRSRMAKGALVVIGNQGGDMDSVAGAIALATFLQTASFSNFLAHNQSLSVHGEKCGGTFEGINMSHLHYDGIYPVINFERAYFHLRKDIQFVLLEMMNINADNLIFIDEIQVDDDTRFFLVDHNAINAAALQDQTGKDRASQVDFVVDHHADQTGGEPQGSVDCYIELVGSCSSLIGTLIKESTQTENGANFLSENHEWSTLLLAVQHQDWDLAKTRLYDKDIMLQLSQWSMWANQLLDLKRSVADFSVEDFFLKDAKGGADGGISFTMPELPIHNMSSFISGSDSGLTWTMQDFEHQVEDFMQKFHYDAVFLLKAPDQSPPPGEFAVLTMNVALVEYMSDIQHMQPTNGEWYDGQNPHLTQAESPFAGLNRLSQGYWTYEHANRKQILPMVKDMLSAFAADSLG